MTPLIDTDTHFINAADVADKQMSPVRIFLTLLDGQLQDNNSIQIPGCQDYLYTVPST